MITFGTTNVKNKDMKIYYCITKFYKLYTMEVNLSILFQILLFIINYNNIINV